MPVFVLFDDATPGREQLLAFAKPSLIIRADAPDEVDPALQRIEATVAAGRHVAGYLSYELGYLLEPRLRGLLPAARSVPLLWFGVFEAPARHEGSAARALLDAQTGGRAYAGALAH